MERRGRGQEEKRKKMRSKVRRGGDSSLGELERRRGDEEGRRGVEGRGR